jgi:CBS domain-containing protein
MVLKEIMTLEVEVIRPNATLKEAARKMKDLDVGLIPVCDGGRLCGMLTDRDITVRSTAFGNNPDKTPVEGVIPRRWFLPLRIKMRKPLRASWKRNRSGD